MKITKKELLQWCKESTPVRNKGIIYKTFYNGRYYFLWNKEIDTTIPFIEKSKGIYELSTNQ